MLLMLTVGLVAAAAALLGLGFAENSLPLVYAAIACAAAGVVATAALGRVARRRAVAALPPEPASNGGAGGGRSAAAGVEAGEAAAAEAPRPGEDGVDATPATGVAAPTGSVEGEGTDELEGWDSGDDLADLGDQDGAGEVVAAGKPAQPAGAGQPEPDEDWESERLEGWDDDGWEETTADERPFPIEDYDRLTVPEVLPRLGDLDPDRLREVRQREEMTKGRGIILGRIASLLAEPAEPGQPGQPAEPAEPSEG